MVTALRAAAASNSESAPWRYDRLIGTWRDAGYDVCAPLHVDSVDHPRKAEFPWSSTWLAALEDMLAVSSLVNNVGGNRPGRISDLSV